MVEVDPATDDFFKIVIESKERAKLDKSLSADEREDLSYFLKILANAGSYGLFVEVNPEPLAKGEREQLKVFSGETVFSTTASVIEKPGPWYCPPIAALITAAGRLLLALLERSVRDRGGAYLLCDTDSMTIVASESGGPVCCVTDGTDAMKAISWKDVDAIVGDFEKLNPYDRSAVRGSILKIEDVNYRDGAQRELLGYSVSAKRYALFTRDALGIQVRKASAHGLGYLFAPNKEYDDAADAPTWIVEGWQWTLTGALGLPQIRLPWFDVPAMMRFTITTPEVLKVLQAHQSKLPYRDRVKPLNFVQSPVISDLGGHPIGCDPNAFTLVAPYSDDMAAWYDRAYMNIHDGEIYRLGRPDRRLPSEAEPMTLLDVISQYRWHPEAKSLAPDGTPCAGRTHGLLLRAPITLGSFGYIGKETDRRWEQGEDISILNTKPVQYRPNETEQLITADEELQSKGANVPIRTWARVAGVSKNTVKAAMRGERLRKSTIEKLAKALGELKGS